MRLGPFPIGMNNRAADHALPSDEGTTIAFRNGVNVDVDGAGKLKPRREPTKVYSGFTKNGYSCPLGAFFVDNGVLRQYGGSAITPVSSDVAYHYFQGTLYFSDGTRSWKYKDELKLWGMARPGKPVLSSASGAYGAGKYLGAVSYVDADGVESGSSEIASVTVTDDSGIVFYNITVPSDQQVDAVRLYLGTANGKELYHVADLSPGTTMYSVLSGRYDDGNILELQAVTPAPAGRIIRFHNGRALIADGNVAWYSEPFSYDQFKLSSNYLIFPDDIDIMEPVAGGIFFAYGDKTEFHAGDVTDGFQVVPLFEYGGIFGSGKKLDDERVIWQSQQGAIVGGPDGSAQNIQEKNVATDTGTSAASLVVERDGLRKFVASIQGATASKLAAKSWIDAEVIRRS